MAVLTLVGGLPEIIMLFSINQTGSQLRQGRPAPAPPPKILLELIVVVSGGGSNNVLLVFEMKGEVDVKINGL